MSTVTIEQAQAHLAGLIDRLVPGEELVILRDNQPVAKLVAQAQPATQPRQPGKLRGTVKYMAPDFDAPLEDFREYME